MTTQQAANSIIYFGKVSSRGDFVKSLTGTHIIHTLDAWIAQGLDLLASDPAWKSHFDSAPAIDFAFLGTRSHRVLAGRLLPSRDSSQRRFPFITASTLEVEQPLAFIVRSPALLSLLWRRLEPLMQAAVEAEDAREPLEQIASTQISLETDPAVYAQNFRDFQDVHTIASIEAMLQQAGHSVQLRRSILAIGLLLQPVLVNGRASAQKGLALPLPLDPLYAALTASFWLELVASFLVRGEFEIGLFITSIAGKPIMVLSFNGASPRTLQSLIDGQTAYEHNIDITDAEWVENYVDNDYAIKKLASYMEHPQLSLRQANETFQEAFLGA